MTAATISRRALRLYAAAISAVYVLAGLAVMAGAAQHLT